MTIDRIESKAVFDVGSSESKLCAVIFQDLLRSGDVCISATVDDSDVLSPGSAEVNADPLTIEGIEYPAGTVVLFRVTVGSGAGSITLKVLATTQGGDVHRIDCRFKVWE